MAFFCISLIERRHASLTRCLKADAGEQGGDSNESFWDRTGNQNLAYKCRIVEVFTCDRMRAEHML